MDYGGPVFCNYNSPNTENQELQPLGQEPSQAAWHSIGPPGLITLPETVRSQLCLKDPLGQPTGPGPLSVSLLGIIFHTPHPLWGEVGPSR